MPDAGSSSCALSRAHFRPRSRAGRDEQNEFVVGPLGRIERVLREGEAPGLGMGEDAQPAGAPAHVLLVPGRGEERALAPQRLDQRAHPPVPDIAAVIGAEFAEKPARAILPIGNERARRRFEEDEAQQVALVIAVEPAAEERGRSGVPAAGGPQPVEPVGRMGDRRHARQERGRRIGGGLGRRLGIVTAGEIEEIGPLGARQRERLGQPAERRGRGLHRAALLDPGAPGRADAGLFGQLLAAQARGAPAAESGAGRPALAMKADEFAEKPPVVRIEHGENYTRINMDFVTGKICGMLALPIAEVSMDETQETHDKRVAAQFGARAQAYVESAVHAGGADLEALAELLRQAAPARALDLGAGGGHVSYLMAHHAGTVTACDLSQEMLAAVAATARARGLGNIETVEAPAEALPFAAGRFDFLACRYSAHHWRDFTGGLREARRVARRGAPAVFIDACAPGAALLDTHLQAVELLRDGSHVRDYTAAEWLGALEHSGFALRACRSWRLRMDFPVWTARMQTPADNVRAIRALQRAAAAEVTAHFAIEGDGSFLLDIFMFETEAV